MSASVCSKCQSPKEGQCRPCKKAWYEKNKERLRKAKAAAYEANKERHREERARYYQANKEKIKAKVAAYAKENGDKVRGYQLEKTYGVSLEVFEQMNAQQGGLCKICGGPPTENRKNLSVDHDHLTGRVRGLLCLRCNVLLGFAMESVDLLDKAKAYLEANHGK